MNYLGSTVVKIKVSAHIQPGKDRHAKHCTEMSPDHPAWQRPSCEKGYRQVSRSPGLAKTILREGGPTGLPIIRPDKDHPARRGTDMSSDYPTRQRPSCKALYGHVSQSVRPGKDHPARRGTDRSPDHPAWQRPSCKKGDRHVIWLSDPAKTVLQGTVRTCLPVSSAWQRPSCEKGDRHVSRSSGLAQTVLHCTDMSGGHPAWQSPSCKKGIVRECRVSQGHGRQTEMEAAGGEIIGGAPTTHRVNTKKPCTN